MSNECLASIWDAIESSPVEVAHMKMRSTVTMAIRNHIIASGMTQAQAAVALGVTQPRISALMRGRINLFSLDTLVKIPPPQVCTWPCTSL